MDTSKFKDVLQKLSFIKDYSSLMLPIIITLVGILVFVFAILMGSKLTEQMEQESITKGGKTVKNLINSVVPDEQWKIEQRYQKFYEADANQIEQLGIQSSQRQLLSYKIFPKPKDISTLLFEEFGQRFRYSIDLLLARINARDCPSDTELNRSLQRTGSSRSTRKRGSSRRRGASTGSGGVESTIIEALCRAKAESASVYANSTDLQGYEFWQEYKYTGIDQAVKDCWYWQIAYWIIEDVVDTIGAMNSDSENVFASPVKRLLGMSFFMGARSNTKSRYSSRTKDTSPGYVVAFGDGFVGSFTTRLTDSDIDVVHFQLAVIVDTKTVLSFMEALCSAKQHKFRGFLGDTEEQTFKHNQITILSSNISPVDREAQDHRLYRYGQEAMSTLVLTCEYIFNKNGYEEIKPEIVKQDMTGQGTTSQRRR